MKWLAGMLATFVLIGCNGIALGQTLLVQADSPPAQSVDSEAPVSPTETQASETVQPQDAPKQDDQAASASTTSDTPVDAKKESKKRRSHKDKKNPN